MSEHEVAIPTAPLAATCSCGWVSDAVDDMNAKNDQADAHMYGHYRVFVESTEEDGATVLCWGTS